MIEVSCAPCCYPGFCCSCWPPPLPTPPNPTGCKSSLSSLSSHLRSRRIRANWPARVLGPRSKPVSVWPDVCPHSLHRHFCLLLPGHSQFCTLHSRRTRPHFHLHPRLPFGPELLLAPILDFPPLLQWAYVCLEEGYRVVVFITSVAKYSLFTLTYNPFISKQLPESLGCTVVGIFYHRVLIY